MTLSIPTQASAVIIGGGIAGCSVAYHLAKSSSASFESRRHAAKARSRYQPKQRS